MDYIVKMDGEKVRSFSNIKLEIVTDWAIRHCRGKIEIIELLECSKLPRASSRIYPNEQMPDLRYKPFVSLA